MLAAATRRRAGTRGRIFTLLGIRWFNPQSVERTGAGGFIDEV